MGSINFYIYLGDSTAEGRADYMWVPDRERRAYLEHSFDGVRVYNANTGNLEALDYVTQNHTQGADKTQFGLNFDLASRINGSGLAPACLAFNTQGGASLAPIAQSTASFSYDKATDTHFNQFVTFINSAIAKLILEGWTINYRAVFCLLGLNDTLALASATNFQTNAQALVNNVYTDIPTLPASTPFIWVSPNNLTSGVGSVDPTNLSTIKSAITALAAADVRVQETSLDGLALKSGDIHHSHLSELGANGYDSVAQRLLLPL